MWVYQFLLNSAFIASYKQTIGQTMTEQKNGPYLQWSFRKVNKIKKWRYTQKKERRKLRICKEREKQIVSRLQKSGTLTIPHYQSVQSTSNISKDACFFKKKNNKQTKKQQKNMFWDIIRAYRFDDSTSFDLAEDF